MFDQVRFLTTAVESKGYPKLFHSSGEAWPEVAVAGRSNVGKSTLLNHLFRRKGLVKTSATPGKTQTINFFSVGDKLSFVDLPGYGYAKVPPQIRKKWGPMVQEYLDNRENLRLVLFLLDIRRIPNEDDLQFMQWCIDREKAVLLVLTKCDKVKRGERARNTQKILKTFDCENLHVVHYSATKNQGRQELMALIKEALDDECETEVAE